MGIRGNDERRIIRSNTSAFNIPPLPAVVAVDAIHVFDNRPIGDELISGLIPTLGSGIVITPNYLLTAAHNIYDKDNVNDEDAIRVRATTSADQVSLDSRDIIVSNQPDNVNANSGVFYLPNFRRPDLDYRSTKNLQDDIALLKTSNTLLDGDEVVGLMAFVNPEKAIGKYPIRTAGYPGDNVPNTLPINNPNNPGIPDQNGNFNQPGDLSKVARDLILAPGASFGNINDVYYNRAFNYTDDIDTFQGQSGSGVWHVTEENKPLVLGIHNTEVGRFDNSGVIFTKDLYDQIIDRTKDTSGVNGNNLPENAIIGSDPGFFSPITGSGNDVIIGTYRKERILGNKGNDKLFGEGADDRLEGGEGTDQALFSDTFTDSNNEFNYDWKITNVGNIQNPEFEFNHTGGTQADGKDTTKDIEFAVFEFDPSNADQIDQQELFYVPLQVDPNKPAKLKDGAEITPEQDILDTDGKKLGELTVTSPAWMFDGDVDYKLSIGSEQGTLYNFAYIIDKSGSMQGGNLAAAKSAYNSLTQYLIDEGIAEKSQFGVVQFNSSARLIGPTSATLALAQINLLYAEGDTDFAPALATAQSFFTARNNNATNIAYFLSDGIGSGANSSLQSVADVRAFGIGNADLSQLNIIDSNNAVLLSNPNDLITEFKASPIALDTIERVDVIVGGRGVVDTISPDRLVEGTLGLEYEGSIEGLEVSREAENEITFELVFNDGTPSTTLDYKITTGQEEVRQQTNNGETEIINFSVNQSDFTQSSGNNSSSSNFTSSSSSQQSRSFSFASASLANSNSNSVIEREIVGNDLDNNIQIQEGQNTIFGNGGNDRFVLLGGVNLVDGGDGVDTVEIGLTQAEAGEISKSGNIISIGKDITALDVEYIEFSDVILDVNTLTATPVIFLADTAISSPEGDTNSTFATFNVNLSSMATEDIVIDVAARADIAEAGIDFVAPSGQLTIAAGESSGQLSLEILGDTDVEGDEEIYLDLTVASGGTFANGVVSKTIGVNVLDNETSFITDEDTLITIPASRLIGDYIDQLYGDYLESDFTIVEVDSTDGTAILNANGNVEFTPAANLNGKVSFELTVTDGTENYTDLVEVNVNPVNDILIANDDTVTTDEDTPLTISATELFGNDINDDIERNLSISAIDNLVNGTAVVSKKGTIRFTPAANFNGTASFDYTVTDGIDVDTASVEIPVNSVNDAPIANKDIAPAIDEDTSTTILATELLSNDSDVEGDSLSITSVGSTNGTAILNADGNIEFTPAANFNGTASFNYIVTDGTDNSTALVEIPVNPVNDILIANNDITTTDEDIALTILATELFDNDINDDIEKSLNISEISNSVNGTAVINGNGNVEFTPAANFNGTASFDYTVTDGTDSETASVEITVNPVNDAPIVTNDIAPATDEDTPTTIIASALLSNDTDIEGDSLNIVGVDKPTNGNAIIKADGNIEFTPTANFNGTASFNYTVTDGTDSSNASVEVVVNPVNDILVAIDDTAITDEDTSITILANELFDNDINDDIEKSLTISQISNLANGTAAINADGNVKFTPAANFNGTASFDYTVTDGTDSETASVEVVVNPVDDAPVAINDTAITDEDTSIIILASELLGNDINYDSEDSLSLIGVNNSANGIAVINENGNIEFTPNLNFNGKASFDYIITDGISNTNASVAVTVSPVNDPVTLTSKIPDITVTQNAPNSVIDLDDYFEDIEDGDNLAYYLTGTASFQGGTSGNFFDIFSINPSTKELTLGYAENIIGTATINAKATDFGSASVETFFTVSVINSTENGDTLVGGDGNDYFAGKQGNDSLVGGNGNDTLEGDEGNDTLEGGNGDDSLRGLNGNDYLIGNEGNDTLKGDNDNDNLDGGKGDDILFGYAGNDTLNGGEGTDRLYVAVDRDITLTDNKATGDGTDTFSNIELANLYGYAGNNFIDARGATQVKTVIKGGDGNDTLRGGAGNDTIFGENDDDVLFGFNGNDTLNGGAGTDRLYVAVDSDITLNDTTVTGDGTDSFSNIELANLYGYAGNNFIDARGATQVKTVIKGGDGNDTLRGGAGNDTIFGENDDDVLFGFNGNDTLNGGAGTDRLYVAVDRDITLSDNTVTGDGTDTFSNIELANLYGYAGNNLIDARNATQVKTVIKGGDGNDTLRGGAGNDTIFGENDDDVLFGGAGDDTLSGNGGADIFALESVVGRDVINDFSDGVDLLNLAGSTSFSDLNIFSNAAGTAVIIRDTSNDNQLLAIINDVRAADITESDFTDI